MTAKPLTSALRIAALSAVFGVGGLLQAPAQAGLVSGSWDPAFGAALPELSWAVQADVLLPNDACANLAGDWATSGPCAGAKIQAVFLRLYDTTLGTPDWTTEAAYTSGPGAQVFAFCDSSLGGSTGAYATRCQSNFGNFFSLTRLRMGTGSYAGNVIGLEGTLDPIVSTVSGQPDSAGGNYFRLDFTLSRPELYCLTCGEYPVRSDGDGLRQFLITYDSRDTSEPRFTDASGAALGVRLDANGNPLSRATTIGGGTTAVPEPGSLALVAGALAAAALLRRRRG